MAFARHLYVQYDETGLTLRQNCCHHSKSYRVIFFTFVKLFIFSPWIALHPTLLNVISLNKTFSEYHRFSGNRTTPLNVMGHIFSIKISSSFISPKFKAAKGQLWQVLSCFMFPILIMIGVWENFKPTGSFESTVQHSFKDSVTVTPRRTEHLAAKAVSVVTALSRHFCAGQIKLNLYVYIYIHLYWTRVIGVHF